MEGNKIMGLQSRGCEEKNIKKIYCENKNIVEDDSQVDFFETSFVRKILIFKSN